MQTALGFRRQTVLIMGKLPKRYGDVRVLITKTVFVEYASRFHLRKNTVLDGRLDDEGNFRKGRLTVYPTHFQVLGKFYFRKAT